MNQYLGDVLASLSDGILIIDRDYTIIYANKRVAELCGGQADGIIGEKCHVVFHASPRPCEQGSLCAHREVFTKEQPVTLKHQHLLPDGSTRILGISATPLRDERGTVDRLVQVLRDITVEERLREEIAASHQTLEAIFNSAPFAISYIDKEMRVIRLNPVMEAMVGFKTEEARGKHCYDCWGQYAHAADRCGRERICDVCQVSLAWLDGEKHSYERRVGGRVIEVVTSPVRDADGAIIGAMEMGYDITDRHEAQSALQQSEQRLRTILDSTTDAIFICDLNARFIEVNRQACLSVGYNREELRHLGVADVDPNFSLEKVQEALWGKISPSRTVTIESTHRHKDGSLFPVEIHIGKCEYGNSQVILGVARDVSERKRAEQALRESENSYRALFESSPNVLCIADLSGIWQYLADIAPGCAADHETFFRENPQELAACLSRLRISKANQAALDLFGASTQQEFIQGLFTIIGPETVAQTAEGLCAIGRGELSFEHETVLHHLLTGEKIYCLLRWNVVPGYEITYKQAILSLTNISSRKIAEDQLAEHRAQLQELSTRLIETEEAERRRIARELHDKLGQQLTAIGLNLNILEQSLPPEQVLAQRKRIADMLRLLEEMTEQVRDIMADLRPPVLDDYGLSAALRWYGEIFFRRTGIAVMVSGSELPRFLVVLELALFRVAQEALTNVAKHSGASEVEIYCHADSRHLTMEIADNGKGIEAAGATMAHGSGFGLISMRERVQAFGGIVQVDSQPGSGVSVVVEVEI